MKDFYYTEWKLNEKDIYGNRGYAKTCKEIYRRIVMESLDIPCQFYIEKLKALPTIYLN